MDGSGASPGLRGHYRSIFVSDIHLGTRGCQADLLLDFLEQVTCDRLFLVGDIVDRWKLKSGWQWPKSHGEVVHAVLGMARGGVEVTYIPGNHDDRVRDFCGIHFGGVVVARDAVHETADGRRFLILHGDAFDGVIRHARWLAFFGGFAYRLALFLNTLLNRARRRMGFRYWSLAAFLKSKVKNALHVIDNFQAAVTAEARRRGLDGVICGHIHKADLRTVDGITYANDGDWVESCTALVEHHDGRLGILRWAEVRSWSMIDRSRPFADRPIAAPVHCDD